jgi:hypothetical protein
MLSDEIDKVLSVSETMYIRLKELKSRMGWLVLSGVDGVLRTNVVKRYFIYIGTLTMVNSINAVNVKNGIHILIWQVNNQKVSWLRSNRKNGKRNAETK